MTTISQAAQQPDGFIIDAIQGRLFNVSTFIEKLRPDGSLYTAQNFSLSDNNEHINGTAFDHKDLKTLDGSLVVMLSKKSRNGRYGGVTVHKEPSATSLFAKNKTLRSALRVSRVGEFHRIADTIKTQ